MTTDWYNGHVEKKWVKLFKLLQLYGVHKATQEARRKGYSVKRRNLDNGTVKLNIGGI